MRATRTPNAAARLDDALRTLADEHGPPREWSNGPGDTYGWHAHAYHKVLFCLRGSIVFHTRAGDVALEEGDRLDVPPGIEHAATVGPSGVRCVEAGG